MSSIPPVIQQCLAVSTSRRVPKGTMIFYQGEVPQSAALLKDGVVKVYNLSPDGEEQLTTFHAPYDIFPTIWLFGQSTSSIYFYEAFTDCEVAFIPRAELLRIATQSNENSQYLLDSYVKNYIGMLLRVTALQQAKASTKISYTLYYLSQRFGETDSDENMTISIKLTHQQFASLVGLTRETTATEMKKLQKAGVINYRNQVYSVDMKKLVEQMGDDSFTNIPIA